METIELSGTDLHLIGVALSWLPRALEEFEDEPLALSQRGYEHLAGLMFRVNDAAGFIDEEIEELLGES